MHIHIVGAGAAGLFAAVELVRDGHTVTMHEQGHRSGTKLLLAGMSGLNLTNEREPADFARAYGKDAAHFAGLLERWSPRLFRSRLAELGVNTFVGTSGKVFPEGMTGDAVLGAITAYLESSGRCSVETAQRFAGFGADGMVLIETVGQPGGMRTVRLEAPVILALGGASYPETGSDGCWTGAFRAAGIGTAPWRPMNCGFETAWTEPFLRRLAESGPVPLKNCALHFGNDCARGDIMVTPYGLEGSPVYALSRELRDAIDAARDTTGPGDGIGDQTPRAGEPVDQTKGHGGAVLEIDLFPDADEATLTRKMARNRGKDSVSNYLRKTLGADRIRLEILREAFGPEGPALAIREPGRFKAVPLSLLGTRPIAEAISSSGGVLFDELDDTFMLVKKTGVRCIGEMLDWDAPTGGYLLQGCFATACAACAGILGTR
jgi:predicted flavoprotein YhiN